MPCKGCGDNCKCTASQCCSSCKCDSSCNCAAKKSACSGDSCAAPKK